MRAVTAESLKLSLLGNAPLYFQNYTVSSVHNPEQITDSERCKSTALRKVNFIHIEINAITLDLFYAKQENSFGLRKEEKKGSKIMPSPAALTEHCLKAAQLPEALLVQENN